MLNVVEADLLYNDPEEELTKFSFLKTKAMPFSEWLKIEDCPFQRNTEARARAADHLKKFDDSHRQVTIAVLPDGRQYKVDGHTRAYLWSQGLSSGVPSPLHLNVCVFRCVGEDRDSLGALYDRFDSRSASKTAVDVTYSAIHELGLQFASPMLKQAKVTNALKSLYGMVKVRPAKWSDEKFTYICVKYFSDELLLLDEADPKQADYVTPILMAAILTFMKYKGAALPFWKKYSQNAGVKDETSADGVQAMRNLLSRMRQKKQMNRSFYKEHLGRAINAFEAFRSNEVYTGRSFLPQPKDEKELQRFIDLAVQKKDGTR